jgi:ACS family hexuronate transporter-like MFS transporter
LPADLFPGYQVGAVSGLSGMGGAMAGIVGNLVTGYIVSRFSYAPIFVMAGLMHPLAVFLLYRLIPEKYFPPSTCAMRFVS